jgi:hypothetical protein
MKADHWRVFIGAKLNVKWVRMWLVNGVGKSSFEFLGLIPKYYDCHMSIVMSDACTINVL